MSLAHSNGPRWVRAQKAEQEKALAGINPIREFLARLFGRPRPGRSARGAPKVHRR